MKLSVKITLTLCILSCCISIMGWFSLIQMQNLNKIYQEISQNWFPSSILIQRVSTLTSEFRRFEMLHIYTSSTDDMKDREESLQRISTQIETCIKEYRSSITLPEEQHYFQALESVWTQYMEIHSKIIVLSRENNTGEAIALLRGKSRELFDTFSNILSANVDLDINMGKEVSADGERMYANARQLILCMMTVLLFLTVVLGVYIIRDMLRKLGKDPGELGALARKVAGGDLDLPTDTNAVGVHADILVMMEKLRQHIESAETITSNIPGGVRSCLQDAECTITYASNGLLNITGYTREELAEYFDNSYLGLVFPDDIPIIQNIQQGLQFDDTYEAEYRLLHKNGQEIWILDRGRCFLDKGDVPLLCCVLIDISELIDARRQLKRQEEMGLAALCATNDFVFEVDRDDLFIMHKGSERWISLFGSAHTHYAEAYEEAAELCHPDDEGIFRKTFSPECIEQAVNAGIELIKMEYRLRCIVTGHYNWFSNSLVPFTATRYFVCINDITIQKQQEHAILSNAQRDSLTGLYNKGHAESEIAAYLEGEGAAGRHALLIVDIDNFKAVNDNLGHLFGDAVISNIACELKKIFRSSDILGRIGGDEFVVLLKDVASDELVSAKAAATCEAFQRTIPGERNDYTLSGSVGIALYPDHASSYCDLYRKMDTALYEAKQSGKNRYCIYKNTSSLSIRKQKSLATHSALTNIVSRAEESSFEGDLLSYIFELLYEARDTRSIVNIILEMIGKHYNVSRAYVFQNSRDDDSQCRNTHEWCREGISSEKEHLKNLCYTDLDEYLARYTKDGVFYCDDISKLTGDLHDILAAQGIRSLLHLAIVDEGKFKGFVGFDECSGSRLWTKKEIHTLGLVAKVLGVFLLKNDMSHQLVEAYKNAHTILDSLDVWAYVIDKDTYELLYINKKTRELSLLSRVGMSCYQAFFGGRSEPCVKCPRRLLQRIDQHSTLEVYNEVLDLWTLASASYIKWADGRLAVLLCCTDITSYKKAPGINETCSFVADVPASFPEMGLRDLSNSPPHSATSTSK